MQAESSASGAFSFSAAAHNEAVRSQALHMFDGRQEEDPPGVESDVSNGFEESSSESSQSFVYGLEGQW